MSTDLPKPTALVVKDGKVIVVKNAPIAVFIALNKLIVLPRPQPPREVKSAVR